MAALLGILGILFLVIVLFVVATVSGENRDFNTIHSEW
jgi:hypothetical protein